MDYTRASQIRKKGLIDLIAEKKFKEGKGLGSSIRKSVSEKLQARSMGIKEKFDPMNLVKALTGEGVVGKSIRTIAGRTMGKSDRDIEYFGGYAKHKKRKLKTKQRKNPDFTTQSSGGVSNLRTGDSMADILAKMFKFMEKTHEHEVLSYKIEEAFREEQMEEDERRHKRLIDSILEKTGNKIKKDDNESEAETFVEKLMSGLKTALAPLLSFAAGIGKMFGKLLKVIPLLLDMLNVFKVIRFILTPIFRAGSMLKWVGGVLSQFLRTAVGPYVALMISAAAIRKWSEGREDLKTSGQRLVEMADVKNSKPVGPEELSKDFKETNTEAQVLRELPIPGTSETLKVPMTANDINDYVNKYKDYIKASNDLYNFRMNNGSVWDDESKKKQRKELEANLDNKKDVVYNKLKEYANRLDPSSSLAKGQEDSLNSIEKLHQSVVNPDSTTLVNRALGIKDDVMNSANDVRETYEAGQKSFENLKNADAPLKEFYESLKEFTTSKTLEPEKKSAVEVVQLNQNQVLPKKLDIEEKIPDVIDEKSLGLDKNEAVVSVHNSTNNIGSGSAKIMTGNSPDCRDRALAGYNMKNANPC